jgi:hypothetical protein
MAAATTGVNIKQRIFDGKGVRQNWAISSNGSLTAAGSTSGHFSNSLNCNALGTTHPGTLVGFPLPNTTDQLRLTYCEGIPNGSEGYWLGYYYRFGTATLNSTVGNRFTHDSTFTRLRRTRFGTANSNINLIPLIYVTAASSVTQATYTMTYADQGGTSTVSPNNLLPAAATNAQGLYNVILDNADCAVLDVTAITCSVATTGGTISVYGFEPLALVSSPAANGMFSVQDQLYGGLALSELLPATTDAGSVTSFLGVLGTSGLASAGGFLNAVGFNNA